MLPTRAINADLSIEVARQNSQKLLRNYEVSRTIRNETRYPGDIQRLSIAVVVNTEVFKKLPAQRTKTEIIDLIKQAAGVNDTRGDEVSLTALPFITPPAAPPESLMDKMNRWLDLSFKGLVVIAVILMMLMAWLWFRRRLSAPRNLSTPIKSSDSISKSILDDVQTDESGEHTPGMSGLEHQLGQLRQMTVNDPEKAASVIKRWIANGEHHA